MNVISGTELKSRQRLERGTFPDTVGLRVHRAISWISRAEEEKSDADAAFIFSPDSSRLSASHQNDRRNVIAVKDEANYP